MRKLLLTLPLLISATLPAQQTNITGGVHAGLSAPFGDFADKKDSYGYYLGANEGLGLQVGGHVNFEFDRHQELRLHATVLGFASKEQDAYDGSYYGTAQNTFGIVQVGGDYLYHFTSPSRGGYLLGGLSLNQVKATYSFTGYPDYEVSQSGRLGFRVGGGYHFNRIFSLEGSLNNVSVDSNGTDGMGLNAITWVSLDAVLRFGGR
ncbi:MAG: hypothetical protein H6Q00_786 [Holophagaceae bacterium]|nr:hypothetical protein [Holophagaceae bacterium]